MRRRRYMQGSGEPPAIYSETDAQFYYRQTSGGVIMDNSPLIGRFDKIKGNTIAWNQLISSDNARSTFSYNGVTFTKNGASFILSGTASAETKTRIYSSFIQLKEHKYFCKLLGSNKFYLVTSNHGGFGGDITSFGIIVSCTQDGSNQIFSTRIQSGTSFSNEEIVLEIIDLTLIYGAGNEPSTVAQFEADYFKWFGKPLTYEANDAGSLRSVKMSGIKSVGFNQWDEEWELFQGQITSKNLIRILPNTSYFFKVGDMSIAAWGISIRKYDANGNLISDWSTVYNSIQTFPEDVSFIKFRVSAQRYGSTTYNNDICINISNANKNGTYEEYWDSEASVPVTTMTGKVNGEGESVAVFPDGMQSAGNVHDEIYKQGGKTYAVKRVGRVDLGSLNWSYASSVFFVEVKDMKISRQDINSVVLCGKYKTVNMTWAEIVSTQEDKIITNQIASTRPYIEIKDLSYSDASTLKTAISGVMCNYELATPIIYELDGFTLPVSYNCAALGTEEILPENTSTPTSVAPIVDTAYRLGHINN